MNKAVQDNYEILSAGFPESFYEAVKVQIMYTSAMCEICTRLENLSQEFEIEKARNPIEHIKHRIKRPESIRNKMKRLGLSLDYGSMRDNVLDIAEVRVICSYINDIYTIADMLAEQDDIITIQKKDYIESPKPNGYRSFHLIAEVPVYLAEGKQMIPVEIQMRTLAMDFWACLEHQLRYKPSAEVPDTVRRRLTVLAGNMFAADVEMQQIYQEIT